MTDKQSPILKEEIPQQTFYAGLEATSLNLHSFIENVDPSDGKIIFTVTQADGELLPSGLQCSADGQFSGYPSFSTISSEPYQFLVVAKNDSDIPLVAYFDCVIAEASYAQLSEHGEIDFEVDFVTSGSEADEVEMDLDNQEHAGSEEAFGDIDKEFEDFLSSLDVDETVDADKLADAFEDANFSNELNDPEYLAFVIRYFLRKFSSLQLYNANESFNELNIISTKDAATGWKIYDSDVALTTTNPKPFATDFSRSEFIATIKEMIQVAADRGWKMVGVKGCDPELGYRLIAEYNQTAELGAKLSIDNFTDMSTWHQRAESEKYKRTFSAGRG